MSSRVLWIILLSAGVLLAAAGCQGDKKDSTASDTLTAVKMQLYWTPDVEFSPFYAAVKEHFYQDEGLDLELLDGGYDDSGNYVEVLPIVLGGQADFGLAGGDQILLARARGEPVVAIAALQQNSPTGFYSLAEQRITVPDDLRGKRIWLWGEDVSYDLFFHHVGLELSDIIPITEGDVYGESGYDALLNGTVDAMTGYVYNEPNVLHAMGYETNFILFQDYGVDLYPDVIFTTEQVIRDKPDVVQAFINGTLRGMRYAQDNPTEMSEYIMTQYRADLDVASEPQLLKTMLIAETLLAAPINSPFARRPGMMSQDTWQATHDDMLALGLLDQSLDLKPLYDLRFVEAYYDARKP